MKKDKADSELSGIRFEIQDTLRALGKGGIEPLKQLFWEQLNYERVNKPLTRRGWTDTQKNALKEDPLLWASGGAGNAFHVIYARLESDKLKLSMERPVIEALLREHPYAIFVFSNTSQNNWHFVNVKIASQREEEENKDFKRRRLFRRITIGPYERLRTATERIQILDLGKIPADMFGIPPLVIQKFHDDAFDVEAVTRSFYEEYKNVFNALQKDLFGQSKDKSWAHDYALQFMNRCMFIYFVQRKHWLEDDSEFFKTFWDSYRNSKHAPDTFFEKWLKVLFFKAFNKQKIEDCSSMPPQIQDALKNAPYLNGGLFSENDLDGISNRKHIKITDNQFSGIINFLEQYNFTVSEDTPLDQEVAVDAEMLGKVYESLVNVSEEADERGDAGIFYTPRTEIDLMCRLSLVDFLTNHLGEENKHLFYEAVFAYSPDEKQSADNAIAKKNLWQKMHTLLAEITVLDPACGSGSFLVGMLQVLDDLIARAEKATSKHESSYNRRKGIIGRSLYGVDVMRWAVEVAELRLWLQLIVESDLKPEDLQESPLLPNLSFKIRSGDSLIQEVGNIPFTRKNIRMSDPRFKAIREKIEKLKEEKFKYFNNRKAKSPEELKNDEFYVFQDLMAEQSDYLIRKRKSLDAHQIEDFITPKQPDIMELTAAPIDSQIAEIEKTRNALKTVKDVPFVWDIAFVEIFEGEKQGFDIVIGNPPYVRQENIADPCLPHDKATAEKKRAYKDKLIRSVYLLYPDFFGNNPDRPTHRLDLKSDLYIYFYFHGLSLLNPKGSFCFITSNSWLDVGYGADLQEFLLNQGRLKMILDNQAKRSFAQADVNTVIALLSSPAMNNHWARFVLFRVPFEQILSPVIFEEIEAATDRRATPEYRVFPITREKLFIDGCEMPEEEEESNKTTATSIKVVRYIGNKWGGKYLRAPDIYWTILEKGKGKLVRLGDIAEVRFGIKTGANEFFYLNAARIKEWGIEEEFLKPVIKSPRECKRILIDPKDLKYKIFMCHKDKKELRGTAALEYIKWGEKQGFHERPSCRGRARWWELGVLKPVYIERSTYNENHDFTYNKIEVIIDKVMYGIDPKGHTNKVNLGICLNSIITALQIEIIGSLGLGEGALFISVEDSKDKIISFDTQQLPNSFEKIFNRFCSGKSCSIKEAKIQNERIELDAIIFDALGLTSGEREAMYEAVINLVEARLNKAQSV